MSMWGKTSFSLSGQPSSSFAGDLQAILCSVYKLYVVTASFQDFANVGAELDVLHSEWDAYEGLKFSAFYSFPELASTSSSVLFH